MTSSSASKNPAHIYRFLAMSMRYPDASWLTDEYLSVLFKILAQLELTKEKEGLEGLSAVDNWIDILKEQHTRLFINAVPHVIAPPYGSVYLNGDGTIYGPSTERTRDFYRAKGYTLASDSEIPDHLVCELDFLAILCEQGRSADEKLFLKTLFRPWFVVFRDRVFAESGQLFYKTAVKLIDFFTDIEE